MQGCNTLSQLMSFLTRLFDGERRRDSIEVVGATLDEALHTLRIDFRERPYYTQQPGEWLARAVPFSKRHERILQPKSGQYASQGIFFSDNKLQLALQHECAIYLLPSSYCSWVTLGSSTWQKELERIAASSNYDLRKIGGGFDAETQIYRTYNTYDPTTGIATICDSLQVASVPYRLLVQNGQVSLY